MYLNPYIKIKPKTKRPYTEIFMIRHCHPDYRLEKKLGEKNMPLSPVGVRQRKYLTRRLLGLGIDSIYTSDLARAKETAAEFIKKSKLIVKISERINEIDWTHWYRIKYFNMSERERVKRLKRYQSLDAELDKMQTEARRAIAEIFKNNKGRKVALFSHGNFIKAFLTSILNADVIGFLSLEIFQSSVSKIVIDGEGYIKIVYINDVAHLPSPPDKDIFITLLD